MMTPEPETIPMFVGLDPHDPTDVISVALNDDIVSTIELGKLVLSNSVDEHGFFHLEPLYSIGTHSTARRVRK